MALDRIHALLEKAHDSTPPFPPTLLYNEGWVLRLVLDWFDRHQVEGHPLNFPAGGRWYSEASLPTPFAATYKGDPLAEGRTNADGVIGHFKIGQVGKSDLVLAPVATHFVVLEAKLFSKLSTGVSKALTYDQAARTVACIAEVLRKAERAPAEFSGLAFYVLAPDSVIRNGHLTALLTHESILAKVMKKVEAHDGSKDLWFEEWFRPTLARVSIAAISWECVLADIASMDSAPTQALGEFYKRCLSFNAKAH